MLTMKSPRTLNPFCLSNKALIALSIPPEMAHTTFMSSVTWNLFNLKFKEK